MQSGSTLVRVDLRRTITMSVTAAVVLVCVVAAAQAPLDSARDLYAAAAYEDALSRLNQLRASTHAPEDERAIEQYRALCLFALGRPGEAERAIESMIAAAPAYRPSDNDASPTVQAAFRDVRRRVLPGIIQQKYNDAKAAFDRKDLGSAKAGFTQVIALLADPIMASGALPQRAELLTLATGFRDLSTPAVPPPAAVPARPVPPQPPMPVVPQPAAGRVYTPADAGVVPPVVVRQSAAALAGVFALRPGAVEILIDEAGAVQEATIRVAVNPVFDRLALATAKSWRYRPATVGGVPVKFRKVVPLEPKATQ